MLRGKLDEIVRANRKDKHLNRLNRYDMKQAPLFLKKNDRVRQNLMSVRATRTNVLCVNTN